MGMFGGIKGAKYSEGGIYVLDGVYRFRIDAIKCIKTRTAKDAYVVELHILESSNEQRLPGSNCTWMVTLDKEPALGNIKQFLEIAVPGLDFNAIDATTAEAAVEQTFHESNPLKGRIVRATANEIKTKAGRPFTKVKFMKDETDAASMAQAHADAK